MSLTVLPGTVVKFMPQPNSSFNSSQLLIYGGQLVANGTAAQPVVFTSGYDDTYGGDSNGDGGATQPNRDDWYNIAFTAPSRTDALRAPESVLNNTIVRYGGEHSGVACQAYGEVTVDRWGRVAISQSEFLESGSAGIQLGIPEEGVGLASVTSSRFADSGCGINARGGDVLNNVFEASISSDAAWMLYPSGLKFYGNWLNKPVYANPNFTRAGADLMGNAFLMGVKDQPSNQDPLDLSANWWGHALADPTGDCWVSSQTYMPAVNWQYISGSACAQAGKATITGYFTQVLPAMTSPPPLPNVGVGGLGGVAITVPAEQLYGAAGQGSAYAYRPAGTQADPVNTAIGAFESSVTDASLPSVGFDLVAARAYTSADARVGPLGRGWSFGYDVSLSIVGSQVTLHAEDGQRVVFTQQQDGSYVGAPGATATLSAVSGGYALMTRDHVRRQFSASGQLLSLTDRNNQGVTFGYDTTGHLITAAAGARSLTFSWNAAGDRLATVSLPDGRHVDYGYTGGLLTSVRDLGGHTTTYTYDTGERLASVTSPTGRVTTRLAYDPVSGRVTDQWDANNDHTTFSFDPNSGTATMTDPRGGLWKDIYQGNVIVARVDPVGASTTYEYNGNLQLIAATDPRGTRSSFGYTAAGDLASFQGPSRTVTTAYNQDHQPVSTVNARSTAATMSYDSVGNLTQVSRPDPAGGAPLTTTYTYTPDGRGLLASVTDARGKASTYTYNAAGDLVATTTAEGFTATTTRDPAGRVTATTDPRGTAAGADPATYTSSYAYNDDDQLLSATDPLGHGTSTAYDDDGLPVSTTDAKGHTTLIAHDDAGHVTSVQGPDPSIPATTRTYDENGNVATATDTSGRTLSYAYNAVNRPIQATTPLGVYAFGFDLAGNLSTVTDPTSGKITFSYDAANRVSSIDYPGTTSDVSYTYDANGNRTQMTDAAGTTSYGFDVLDQLSTVTRGGTSFTYGYDPNGQLTRTTYPDGTVNNYTYSDDGLLTTAAVGATPLATYQYDPAGNLTSTARHDGSTATRTIDPAGYLTHLSDTTPASTLLDESYTYDANGSPTSIHNTDGSTDTYRYDTLDRLTQVCYATTTCQNATDYITWAYDNSGNILTETRPTGTSTHAYNSTGQLTSITSPTGTTNYGYNALGQQTSAGATTNTYDGAGRTKTITTSAGVSTYTYDGDGKRLTAAAGSATTKFSWDPKTYDLALERDGQDAVIRRYSYGADLTSMSTGGQDYYFHADRQGSIRALTDASGNPQTGYTWEPYGKTRSLTHPNPAGPANPMQWTGQYADPTGAYHLRARQYDPTTGAFTSTDPAGAVPFSATYSYGAANPMVYTDPLGLDPDWRSIAQTTHDITGTAAGVLGGISLILTATGVGAPLAAVTGSAALVLGVVTAGTGVYLAWDTCTNGKGSCMGAVVTAGIDTAAVIPIGRLAKSGIQAATTAKTGASVLESLSPAIRTNVDDAIERAAANKIRFSGHDGKVYDNWDKALPSGGNYTEWTAAQAGAKRGTDRVIIEGDPRNPNAIYYWDHVNPPVRIDQ